MQLKRVVRWVRSEQLDWCQASATLTALKEKRRGLCVCALKVHEPREDQERQQARSDNYVTQAITIQGLRDPERCWRMHTPHMGWDGFAACEAHMLEPPIEKAKQGCSIGTCEF